MSLISCKFSFNVALPAHPAFRRQGLAVTHPRRPQFLKSLSLSSSFFPQSSVFLDLPVARSSRSASPYRSVPSAVLTSEIPSSLRLTYFDIAGFAEPIRLAFVIGEIPFEDERLTRDEWISGPNGKVAMPMKAAPVLTINGDKKYPQSSALLRYAGRLAGLVPEDALQQLLVDCCLATVEEATAMVVVSMREADLEKRKERRKVITEEIFPRLFNGLSKVIEENGASPGFAVGNSTTIADLSIYNLATWVGQGVIDDLPADSVASFPVLAAIHAQVASNPKVMAYYESKQTVAA
eukprot:TRINITY_DN38662_c0_g1_i1.p1 TRINITY_DN38662_c0_g1~~TRINITY_DN38662_c0_g1_i1.p1  ORF type:complete len:294 (-),score=41.58 TRINITY_DN38662_c0_g1_i1:287-1168(-)